MTRQKGKGVKRIPDDFDNELQIHVKLFTVLYADDTVLMSESAEELQSGFNYIYEYCKNMNLKVNRNKSKVIDFSKGMWPMNLKFKMNNMKIEIVSELIYLGTMLQWTDLSRIIKFSIPMLTYGSQIWRYENIDILEKNTLSILWAIA